VKRTLHYTWRRAHVPCPGLLRRVSPEVDPTSTSQPL